MGFVHEGPGQEAGDSGEDSRDRDGGVEAGEGGGDAADKGADGVAGVAPEAVDAQGGCPPAGVGGVADRGEEGGVDQGGADAEEEGARSPAGRASEMPAVVTARPTAWVSMPATIGGLRPIRSARWPVPIIPAAHMNGYRA